MSIEYSGKPRCWCIFNYFMEVQTFTRDCFRLRGVMLLLFVSVAVSGLGFSAGKKNEELCYGKTFDLPMVYSPMFYTGKIYFMPKGQGVATKRVIMDNGQSDDPRFKVNRHSIHLTDVKETDAGTYSRDNAGSYGTDAIRLEVSDCADAIKGVYGETLSLHLPGNSHYLEFVPTVDKEPRVLWNRTNSQFQKGKVLVKGNNLAVYNLTQMDNGYYNLRMRDNTLVNRKKLNVKASTKRYKTRENEELFIYFPNGAYVWTVTYIPDGDEQEYTVVDRGVAVRDRDIYFPLQRRFYKWDDSIGVTQAEGRDSGHFYFKDRNGNLVQTVRLEVAYSEKAFSPAYAYIIATVLMVLVLIICGCCVKKCCCKRSPPKRNEPAPAVQLHERTRPPVAYGAAPAPTAARVQPVRPAGPTDPPTFSIRPSVGAQPTASPPGFQVQSDFLSTDAQPTFELKGLDFPSAQLLGPDSTPSYVYTSDKLNFL